MFDTLRNEVDQVPDTLYISVLFSHVLLHRVVKGKILLVFRAITVITMHLRQIIKISTSIHGERTRIDNSRACLISRSCFVSH